MDKAFYSHRSKLSPFVGSQYEMGKPETSKIWWFVRLPFPIFLFSTTTIGYSVVILGFIKVKSKNQIICLFEESPWKNSCPKNLVLTWHYILELYPMMYENSDFYQFSSKLALILKIKNYFLKKNVYYSVFKILIMSIMSICNVQYVNRYTIGLSRYH